MTESNVQDRVWKAVGGVLGDNLELAFLSSNTERAWGYLRKGDDLFLLKKETPAGVPFSELLAVDQVVPAVEGWLDSVEAVSQEIFFGALELEGVAKSTLVARLVPLSDLVPEDAVGVVEVS